MILKRLRKAKIKNKNIDAKMCYIVGKLNEITPLYIQTFGAVAFPSIEITPGPVEDMFTINAQSGEFQLLSIIDYDDIFDSIRSFCHSWNLLTAKKDVA